MTWQTKVQTLRFRGTWKAKTCDMTRRTLNKPDGEAPSIPGRKPARAVAHTHE